jgi:glycosyltransferase involved in cell wall biosynthesis
MPQDRSDRAPLQTARRVTVITVCRNAARHIGDCIRSVRMQDHPDVEHVVIDGASIDGTQEIVRAEAPQAVLVSERDCGLYDAMNKGIAIATGEYIALLNADDRYARPDILSLAARTFAQEGCAAVIGDVEFFDPDRPGTVVRRYDSSRFRPERIRHGVMPAHPATILTAEAYRTVGKYRTDFRIASDFDFILRAFLLHKVSYVYVPQVFVAMATGGVSNRGLASARTVTREMLQSCREHGVATTRLKLWSRIPAKLFELTRR